ncbi:MAG TPA: glycerate kinase [Acidimicrobiales bacterium]|nr:glycerate kinase [Acidimicrobiales bacterium]
MSLTKVLLAAPDKFRGSLAAKQASQAMAAGAAAAGWGALQLPLADGGEGTLDVLGGANRETVVTGPLGQPVAASWQLQNGRAVIEMATASGLSLVGGKQGNDPVRASTRGTGELIAEAIEQGAREIIVAVGGSATTDGGLGAQEALEGVPFSDLGVSVRVASDVETLFLDAARVFGPQKGAGEAAVVLLTERLEKLGQAYADRYGVDVRSVPGSGAAGGLAGGLAALGAEIVPGFALVASTLGLDKAVRESGAVVTGEGRLDSTSFSGKVVGGVFGLAKGAGVPYLAVVGSSLLGEPTALRFASLTELYGEHAAWHRPAELVAEVTQTWLESLGRSG